MRTAVKKDYSKTWLKKAGIVAFLFFFIKGLVWIGVAIWAWYML